MINYAMFGANNVGASGAFFEAVLAPLGYKKCHDGDSIGFAVEGDFANPGTVWVGPAFNREAATPSNGTMIGFSAPSRQSVRDMHAAALANGGSCAGPPGLRENYGPNMYLAYVRDPVGNKFSAICMAAE
ncbi:MAG: Glyoxalase/bleomycin resistance protein/dioxygenase [Hyphomonadaceae bacterium]|nr:MAG: Glyoxalase/bleomycin resistance protein/dioxygenase [Hyphomonadaceae bacterium]KAF0184223.1 MAG: Glyoxalase/bleomycin resistance protein/dioxygenase [Hyphomonadaceae bacterium]